jgi:hypothetical protein
MRIAPFLSFGRLSRRVSKRTAHPAARRSVANLVVERLEERTVPSAVTISGFVFNDGNDNGLFDAGEVGIGNNTIQLLNASGTVIGTAVTSANGFYQFASDSSISTAPTTLTENASVPNSSTDWTNTLGVAPFNPALGTLTSVEIINSGSFISDIKVESLDNAPSTITATDSGVLTLTGPDGVSLVTNLSANKMFNATAFDGTIDFGGTSGHDFGPQTANGSNMVTLNTASELQAFEITGQVSFTENAHATSSATGAGNLITQINTTAGAQISVVYTYIPSNALKPGNYTIVQTSTPPGFLDGLESSNGGVIPNSVGSHRIPVTLLAGNSSSNNDFAEVQPASVAGFVYLDSNGNGVKDAGEPGIPGATVTLTGTNDLGASINIVQMTAGDGSYQFAGLRPGNYTLTKTPLSNYLDGKDALGSVGGVVGTNNFSAIGLGSGGVGVNYDFAELQLPGPTSFIYSSSFSMTSSGFDNPLNLQILSKLEFLSSDPPGTLDPTTLGEATFVDGLYHALLNRAPDATGLVNWVVTLQNGMSRAQVVSNFWNSAEHRGLEVDYMYKTFLHRGADPAGRAAWINTFLGGATEFDVARAFIDSGEYQAAHASNTAYIGGLYADILGRTPGANEMSAWLQMLQNGMSRDAAAVAFLTSGEAYVHMLNNDYLMYLHRNADAGGEQVWLALLESGQATPQAVSQAFLASDEFFAMAVQASQG